MRRVFSGLVRGFAVGAVVLALGAPVGAQPRFGERSPGQRIIKAIKFWITTILEDRMSEPKP
jgi:hypothetical protein